MMQAKKTWALLLAVCLVFALALAGCQNDNGTASTAPTAGDDNSPAPTENNGETPGDPAAPTTLTFWTFQNSHQEFLNMMVAAWNAENPNRTIVLEPSVFSYDDNHNNLLIALQSGTGAPDIVDIEIGRFANYLKGTPQLVPMNAKIEPLKDKLVMSRFENYSKDGQYYGMDYHVGIPVIYYNTEICEAAGVDIDAIKTWDQYVEAGKKVLAETGKPMTTLEVTEHWSYYPLVTQRNSDWFDASGNVTMDNAANAEVLQFLYDMLYDSKIAVPAPGGFHHAEEWYGFMNGGGAASVWMPQWFMNRFTDYMPDLIGKIAIRPLPTWTEGGAYGAGMGGTGTVVTNQCAEPDLAIDFLVYAKLSDKGAVATWTELGFDPLRTDVYTWPEMKAENKFTDYYGTGTFDMLAPLGAKLHAINFHENFPQAQTLIQSNVVFKVLSEKSMTPAEALAAAAEELRAQ